jgi:hypothetical protein
MAELKKILTPTARDTVEALDMKLSKWPAMVKSGTVADAEYKDKQKTLISEVMTLPAADEDSFKFKSVRVLKLKEKEWISEMDFHGKKVEMLKEVGAIGDDILRTRLYLAARDTGLISSEDYEAKKNELIKDIFAPSKDEDEFTKKIKMLMDLNKNGIINDEEYNGYKTKIMNEL